MKLINIATALEYHTLTTDRTLTRALQKQLVRGAARRRLLSEQENNSCIQDQDKARYSLLLTSSTKIHRCQSYNLRPTATHLVTVHTKQLKAHTTCCPNPSSGKSTAPTLDHVPHPQPVWGDLESVHPHLYLYLKSSSICHFHYRHRSVQASGKGCTKNNMIHVTKTQKQFVSRQLVQCK